MAALVPNAAAVAVAARRSATMRCRALWCARGRRAASAAGRASARRPLGAAGALSTAVSDGAARAAADADVHTFTVGESAKQKGPAGAKQKKLRLDAFLSASLPDVSRNRLQRCIRDGLVSLNGAPCESQRQPVRVGDVVCVGVPPPPPCEAAPQDIPLDVVHEDDQCIVVNKAPGMVCHPSPGHEDGTLVNALLHHLQLPAVVVPTGAAMPVALTGEDNGDADEGTSGVSDADELVQLLPAAASGAPLRPGIVHRLDVGTSGLLVVAKSAQAHAHLCEQFKARTVEREYVALLCGAPDGSLSRARQGEHEPSGRVETYIGRDPKQRLRMAALPEGSSRGRRAASNWQLMEQLAGGAVCVSAWRLETGRTHQIRVHAAHTGAPLLGDVLYGGTATRALQGVSGEARREAVSAAARDIGRPALHARTLAFDHPTTGERLRFECDVPDDMTRIIEGLEETDIKAHAQDVANGKGRRHLPHWSELD